MKYKCRTHHELFTDLKVKSSQPMPIKINQQPTTCLVAKKGCQYILFWLSSTFLALFINMTGPLNMPDLYINVPFIHSVYPNMLFSIQLTKFYAKERQQLNSFKKPTLFFTKTFIFEEFYYTNTMKRDDFRFTKLYTHVQ